MCYIDGQKNKYSVLNECNRMLKYNIENILLCTEALSLVPDLPVHHSDLLPFARDVTSRMREGCFHNGERRSEGILLKIK
jgi:hypothetical protein